MWHLGALPSRHQSLGHRHGGVPDAEAQPVAERRLRLRQAQEVQHLAQLQLHGPTLGLREDTRAQQPLRQPLAQRPALLHYANQSQHVPARHAGVHMKASRESRVGSATL